MKLRHIAYIFKHFPFPQFSRSLLYCCTKQVHRLRGMGPKSNSRRNQKSQARREREVLAKRKESFVTFRFPQNCELSQFLYAHHSVRCTVHCMWLTYQLHFLLYILHIILVRPYLLYWILDKTFVLYFLPFQIIHQHLRLRLCLVWSFGLVWTLGLLSCVMNSLPCTFIIIFCIAFGQVSALYSFDIVFEQKYCMEYSSLFMCYFTCSSSRNRKAKRRDII